MKTQLWLLLLLISACHKTPSTSKLNQIRPGETSLQEVIAMLDEPKKITPVIADPPQKLYEWDNLAIQADDRLVRVLFRGPSSAESEFHYWRHFYRDVPYQLKRIERQKNWQMTVPSEGISIIYDEITGKVTKVIYHEAP